jgi:hypothetical protein
MPEPFTMMPFIPVGRPSAPPPSRNVATILAALRVFQDILKTDDNDLQEMDHFEEVAALSVEEIDALCERINFDGLKGLAAERHWHFEMSEANQGVR